MDEKINLFDRLGTHTPEEMQERSGGRPVFPEEERTVSKRGEGEIFTVVYLMPDGDAVIRYQKFDSNDLSKLSGERSTFLAQQAFLVMKVIPSLNGAPPAVEFLKVRDNVSKLMEGMVKAFITDDEPQKKGPAIND